MYTNRSGGSRVVRGALRGANGGIGSSHIWLGGRITSTRVEIWTQRPRYCSMSGLGRVISPVPPHIFQQLLHMTFSVHHLNQNLRGSNRIWTINLAARKKQSVKFDLGYASHAKYWDGFWTRKTGTRTTFRFFVLGPVAFISLHFFFLPAFVDPPSLKAKNEEYTQGRFQQPFYICKWYLIVEILTSVYRKFL